MRVTLNVQYLAQLYEGAQFRIQKGGDIWMKNNEYPATCKCQVTNTVTGEQKILSGSTRVYPAQD